MSNNKQLVSIISKNKNICHLKDNSIKIYEFDTTPSARGVALVLADKDFVSYSFEDQKDLTPEQLEEKVEIKMYQDAGLNPMLEYKIAFSYTESLIDHNQIVVQCFAISNTSIANSTKSFLSKFGYIDVLLPASTLPYSLYNKQILEPKNDVFIYFESEQLSISIFTGGKFIYSKQLDSGLKKIGESYNLLSGEQVKFDLLMEYLITKGIDEEKYSFEDKRFAIDFRDILSNIINNINSIILYSMRVSGLKNIERIFIGTSKGVIPGANQLAQEILSAEGFDYIFYTDFFLQDDEYVDQRQILSLLELSNINNLLHTNPFNLTANPRPSSFLKRPAGTLIITTAVISILILLYPIYLSILAQTHNGKTEEKLQKLQLTKSEFLNIKSLQEQLINKRKEIELNLKEKESYFVKKVTLIDDIKRKKEYSSSFINFINGIFRYTVETNALVKNISYSSGEISIDIESNSGEKITSLINTMTKDGYNLKMDTLIFDYQIGAFKSTIKVIR